MLRRSDIVAVAEVEYRPAIVALRLIESVSKVRADRSLWSRLVVGDPG
jgi:hypothetical protein